MEPAADFLKINISEVLTTNFNQFQQFILFLQSIEWSEPWLIGLVCFHFLISGAAVATRKRPALQGALFLLLVILIFLSERLNEFAAENWQYYSKQQYFDKDGMFISLMFSAPLLFNCMLMVANWLLISSELMTSLRRFQLQHQSRRSQEAGRSTGNAGEASASAGVKVKKSKESSRLKKD